MEAVIRYVGSDITLGRCVPGPRQIAKVYRQQYTSGELHDGDKRPSEGKTADMAFAADHYELRYP
jgi:hypothetical protein